MGLSVNVTAIWCQFVSAIVLETVLRPDPDTRVVGFKEIYWMPERLPDYLAFIRAVFPGARFVLAGVPVAPRPPAGSPQGWPHA